MNKFIILLRGVNVSGKNKLPMKELRELLTSFGFQHVQTYIQSGNIILNSDLSTKEIEHQITRLIGEKYGYEVPSFAYTAQDWKKILDKCPYVEGERSIYFTFLNKVPENPFVEIKKGETDEYTIINNMVYLYCLSYGKTKLSNNLFENKLKVRATSRNNRTVIKLFEMVTNS